MGARTDFIRAMLIGVVIGVALTIAFFQLRGKADISAAPQKPIDGSAVRTPIAPGSATAFPADDEARTRELAQLRARIAELERAGSNARRSWEPDAEHGMSTSDDWWAKVPANPAWDDAREQKVIDRLAKLGVKLDPKDIECKTRCCRFSLDGETYDERFDEIDSSVGVDFEMPDGMGTSQWGEVYRVTKCWSTKPPEKPIPDRAQERDALLAKIDGDLKKCGQGVSPAITLKLGLHVDQDGQIEKVDSNAKQLGQKAASCAETAVLQAASFAASPMDSLVPLTLSLGK